MSAFLIRNIEQEVFHRACETLRRRKAPKKRELEPTMAVVLLGASAPLKHFRLAHCRHRLFQLHRVILPYPNNTFYKLLNLD